MLDALKRMFVTALGALGALGVGALATVPAFAQQLPAPDLYTDITACSAMAMLPTSPTMDPRGDADSPLDTILDVADLTVDAADVDATELEMLNGLLDLTNCMNPVSDGVSQAVDIFNEYNAAKAALPGADADPDPDATARYNRAKEALDNFRGSVYNEVYNQRTQQEAVNDAVDDYNMLVGAGGEFALLKTGYDGIVVNNLGTGNNNPGEDDDDESWGRIYGSSGVRGYQAIDTTGEFDAAGVLQLEDDPSTSITTLGGIATELGTRNAAVKTAQENLDNAIAEGNTNLSPLRETLRRATKARDHVQSELSRLTSIVRAENRDTTDITIGSGEDERTLAMNEREVLAEYGKIQGQVDAAEAKVRSTVTALESANEAVRDALASPDDYLDQLVTLRTFQKAAADAAVADAGTTPAPSLVTAAEEAAERLADAEGQRDAHGALVSDTDSPASALLNALLEPEMKDGEANPADDDGRAVIDAIAATYDETQVNSAAIAAIGVTGSEVEANTAQIATNTADIADHETRITGNETMLADHETRITGNETMLADHEMRITGNEAMLVDHGVKLAQKKQYIDNLGAHIGVDPVTGMGIGEGGMSRIDMNEMRGMHNSGMIETNSMGIMENRAMIESNQMSIMRNMEDIQTLKSGVAASMALGGMPEMGARGVSVGAGSYGGETALAVGVHFSGENSRFKIGVTSSGGETGASLGAGWSF